MDNKTHANLCLKFLTGLRGDFYLHLKVACFPPSAFFAHAVFEKEAASDMTAGFEQIIFFSYH